LESQDDTDVKVKRNGKEESIHVNDVVVGDILKIDQDLKLNADGIIIQSNAMMCNESDMTGEKDDLKKKPFFWQNDKPKGEPFLFKGCTTTAGDGTMLVTCVGKNTNQGSNQKSMDFEDELTPLQ